ncbi:hypothetical protein O9993_04745 [Vibrio lentus]|nr:hypothetical protein [Vibrio lentus]
MGIIGKNGVLLSVTASCMSFFTAGLTWYSASKSSTLGRSLHATYWKSILRRQRNAAYFAFLKQKCGVVTVV